MSETQTESIGAYSRPELLQVAETVARDKGIEREEVLEAMEQAIQKAGRSKYGHEHDIRATIDRTSGEISLARYVEVMESPDLIENDVTQVDIDTADAALSAFGTAEMSVDTAVDALEQTVADLAQVQSVAGRSAAKP